MKQQYVCGAVETSAGRCVCASSGKNDTARSHQTGQHNEDH